MEKNPFKIVKNNENNGLAPEAFGLKFNEMSSSDFTRYLKQIIKEKLLTRLMIVADWVNVQKARAAKALMDQYSSDLNIDSIIIRATARQYHEDVNAFQLGVEWQAISE